MRWRSEREPASRRPVPRPALLFKLSQRAHRTAPSPTLDPLVPAHHRHVARLSTETGIGGNALRTRGLLAR